MYIEKCSSQNNHPVRCSSPIFGICGYIMLHDKRGIKVADGIKFANEITLRQEEYGHLGGTVS